MNCTGEIRELLEQQPKYRSMLFCRGYLATSKKIDTDKFPFYGEWNKVAFKRPMPSDLNVYVHKIQKYFVYEEDDISAIIIGHLYNPFEMKYNENEILQDCVNSYKQGENVFFSKISELTGINIFMIFDKEKVIVIQDACGIMPVYYGSIDEEIYFSSHGQLIADICGLEMTLRIKKYINASFYRIGISQLCGLDTPFDELTMLSPNTYLRLPDMEVKRFYPKDPVSQSNLSDIEKILKNSMELCSEKWMCSISLTGGIDSKMTLSAANGIYDRFEYFSFVSTEAEKRDALAAHQICSNLGLEHKIYYVSEESNQISDFDVISVIMAHNQGYIKKRTGNDARKRAYLMENANIEVEIKSHVSEIGRAFYYKKLGKKKFEYPITPRNMSNLAKRNFFSRRILKDMDNSFNRFINITAFGNFPEGYDESDMFYWENRLPAWGALVKQSFDVSHETTIIYNNRKLLEMFFSFPIKDRIDDSPQKSIIRDLNPVLFNMEISNNNAMKSKKRILPERIFFELNSITFGERIYKKTKG